MMRDDLRSTRGRERREEAELRVRRRRWPGVKGESKRSGFLRKLGTWSH